MGAILWSFRRCPYAMRGRMGLKASGVDYEHREIILRDKPQEMLDASPKGTVPVFIKSNGDVIDESLDVLNWALKQNDPLGWLDCDMDEASKLIKANDTDFKHHLDRYKYASRYDDQAKRGDTNMSHRLEAETYIQDLEDHLNDGPYLLGKKQSLADIAIFPFMRQFSNVEPDWWASAPYPKTRDWLDRHLESDLFKAVMKKFPLWKNSSSNSQ